MRLYKGLKRRLEAGGTGQIKEGISLEQKYKKEDETKPKEVEKKEDEFKSLSQGVWENKE